MATTFQATDDPEKAADLRRMKRRASGLLVLVTAIFVLVRTTTDSEGWAGYVEAAAEAAMVGGVADWFAVTALFRHPRGLPIPHTAIIPRRKDAIGASLGTFVQENFLDPDMVAERVNSYGVAKRAGQWLAEPDNAARLGAQSAAAIDGVSEMLQDDEVAASIESMLRARIEQIPVTLLAAKGLEAAIEGGHHQAALDVALRGATRLVQENAMDLRSRLYEESPWWVPEAIDDRVFDKIQTGITSLAADVLAKPDHELRALLDTKIRQFAADLETSPDFEAKGEEFKAQLLDHPEVRDWLNSLWDQIKSSLIAAAEDPTSEFRQKIESTIVRAGESLATDPLLQAKVDGWIESVVRYGIEQSGSEVANLISTTVEGWDAQQTGERTELQVGHDLQFIRINGTVVGGLVGTLIHAVGEFL